MHAHQVKPESVDMVFLTQYGSDSSINFPHDRSLAGGLIIAGCGIGKFTIWRFAGENTPEPIAEENVSGQYGMVVDYIHHHPQLVFMKCFDQLLELTDPGPGAAGHRWNTTLPEHCS